MQMVNTQLILAAVDAAVLNAKFYNSYPKLYPSWPTYLPISYPSYWYCLNIRFDRYFDFFKIRASINFRKVNVAYR